MIQNTEHTTTTKQRIVIAVIAAAMIISTAALYFGIMASYRNTSISAAEEIELSELLQQYREAMADQGDTFSALYFDLFRPYLNDVRAFNATEVKKLKTRDLKVGEGREITAGDSSYSAYYIGWLNDGEIFDSSFDDPRNPVKLYQPLAGSDNLIDGWVQGVVGMHIGGVREITIPYDLGYGEAGYGENIPGYAPLKFIIMLIETPQTVPFPDRLWELYTKKYGNPYDQPSTTTEDPLGEGDLTEGGDDGYSGN